MADDKSNRGGQDRSRVSGEQGFEVDYFARKHGITKDQAQRLIKEHGSDPTTLDAAAEELKG